MHIRTPGYVRTATMSSSVAAAITASYGAMIIGLVAMIRPGFGSPLANPALLAPLVVVYPFVVGTLVRRSRSELAVPGIGAVIPSIGAAALAVHAPYTWRAVAAPLAIGVVGLVAIWVAAAILDRMPARRASPIGIIIGVTIAVIGWFIAGVLMLPGTTHAPLL